MWNKSRPSRVLAIDWDQRNVRIVHARFAKKVVRIDKILAASIPIDVDAEDPAQIGAHIKAVLQQESISTRTVIIDIPRDQVVLNTLSLPGKNPDLLPGMVQMQIGKELTFPTSEAVVDFAVPPLDPDAAKVDVLVAAVRHEVLVRYQQTMTAAGLKLLRVGLRPHAARVAILDLLGANLPERVLFVDVRPSLTEIDVIRKGQLAFSRAASVHVPDNLGDKPQLAVVRPADDEAADPGEFESRRASVFGVDAVVNSLIMELTRSIEAYRAQDPGAKIDKVIVGGDVGVEEELADAVRRRLRIEAEPYNPAASFDWSRSEGEAAAAYAATLGLVLGHAAEDDLHFDFLHPKKTVSQTEQRLRRAPAIAATLVFLLVCLVFAGWKITRADRQRLANLEQQVEHLDQSIEAKKKFIKVADHVRSFEREQIVWIDVLYELTTLLPDNKSLVLDDLTLDESSDRITVKVRTKDLATGHKFVETLNGYLREGHESPRFKAQIRSTGTPGDGLYKYAQHIVVEVLNDTVKSKKSRSSKQK